MSPAAPEACDLLIEAGWVVPVEPHGVVLEQDFCGGPLNLVSLPGGLYVLRIVAGRQVWAVILAKV